MTALLDRMMDFDLTEDQRLVRQTVRRFAEAEILPHVERYEREERYPSELIAKLPAMGLLGPMIPEEYGGSFTDVVTYGVICEELARVDWVIASVVSVANSLVAGSLLRFGTQNFAGEASARHCVRHAPGAALRCARRYVAV